MSIQGERPPQAQAEAQAEADGGYQTDSTDARFSYTNDVLAAALIFAAIGLSATYVYYGDPVPIWLATVDAIGMTSAFIWAFGKGAMKEATTLLKNQPPER